MEFRLELFGIEFPASLRAEDHSIAVDAVSKICSDEVAVLEREGTRLVPVDGRFVGVVPGAVYHVVTALEQLSKTPTPVAPVPVTDVAQADEESPAAGPQSVTKEITRGVTPPSARDAAVRPKKKVPLSLALDGDVTVPVQVEPVATSPAQQQVQEQQEKQEQQEQPKEQEQQKEQEGEKVSHASEHSISGFFKRLVKKTQQQQQQQQQQQENESTEQVQQSDAPTGSSKDEKSEGKQEEGQEKEKGDTGIQFLAPKEGEETAARGIAAVLADDGHMPEDKNERLRLKCVREIILTEEAYLEDLETLESVFMMPIQFQQVLSAEQFQRLFSNAAMLKPIHEELVQKLKDETAAASSAGVHVGAAFLALCQYMKMYTVYCANHDSAVALLEELKQDKAFMHTLGVCETDRHARGQGLASFLIKPVQRVCKYPLFFRELLGFTPADDPDHAALAEAKARIDDVVRHINEGKRKLEQQQKMVDILASIDGEWADELITPTRYLVSETRLSGRQKRTTGSGSSSSSSSSIVGGTAGAGAAALRGSAQGGAEAASEPEPDALATHGERHDYMLFVFSDLVVVCRCAVGAGRHGRPYVLRAAIPMYCVRVVVIADDERVRNSFEVLHANPVTSTVDAAGGFQFFARDAGERDTLVRTLKTLVKDTLRKFYAHRSNRAALISLAPPGAAASSEPVTPPPEAVAAAAAGNELAAATGEAAAHHPS